MGRCKKLIKSILFLTIFTFCIAFLNVKTAYCVDAHDFDKYGLMATEIQFSYKEFNDHFSGKGDMNAFRVEPPLHGTLKYTLQNGNTYVISSVQDLDIVLLDTLTYTPDTNFAGVDSFYWYGRDSEGWSTFAKVFLRITEYTPPNGSININSGAVYTNSTTVTLNLYGHDGQSGLNSYRVSNDSFNWSGWFPQANGSFNVSHTIPGGDGTKTVYVRYKDNAGNESPIYSESIILDATAPTGTMSINEEILYNGIKYTKNQAVGITLTKNNDSTVSHMRFSNTEAGIGAANWETYNAARSDWALSNGNGYKTVYYQLKDVAGNLSQVYCENIAYDNTKPQISISVPSQYVATKGDTVEYIITYSDNSDTYGVPEISANNGMHAITLVPENVTISKIGTVDTDKLSIAVEDVAGQPLQKKIIINIADDVTGEGTVGVALQAGTVEDNAGNKAAEAVCNFSFSVDLNAPANQDQLFTGDLFIKGGQQVALATTSKATGGHLSDSVRFAPVGYDGKTAANGSTITSTHGESQYINAPLKGGTYKLYIIDGAGNISEASKATLTVKNEGPVASIEGPDLTHVRASSTVEYIVTFSNDTESPTTIAMEQGDVSLLTTGNANAYIGVSEIPGEPLKRKVTLSNLMGEGTVKIKIAAGAAKDSINNPSAVTDPSNAVKVDNTPAALTEVNLVSSNSNPVWAKKGDTLLLTFAADEEIKTPTVTIAGQSVTATNDVEGFVGDKIHWKAAYTIPGDNTLNHLDGQTTPFSIITEDLAANVAGAVTAVSAGFTDVTLDFTNPVVTADNNDTGWKNNDITVALTYTDSSIGSRQYKITTNDTTTDDNWQDYTGQIKITSDGIYYLHYKAVDITGNSLIGVLGPFKLDKTAPELTGVENDKTYGNSVTVTYTDVIPVTAVLKKFDDNSNDYQTVNDTFTSGTAINENGQYRVIAADNAGNQTTVTFTIQLTQQQLSAEAERVEIGYAPGDSAGSVTKNLTLPAAGDEGTGITWSSANETVISTSGAVTRPEPDAANTEVTLTAALTKNGNTVKKTFNLTVIKKPSDADEAAKAAEDWANIVVGYAPGDSAASVTQNVTLELKGKPNNSGVSWQSSDEGLLSIGAAGEGETSVTGTVKRPAFTQGDKQVILTARISREGTGYEIKTFILTIKHQAGTIEEEVQEDADTVAIGYAAGDSAGRVTQNVTLPVTGQNGSTVTWQSSRPSVLNHTDGSVSRQSANTAVTLTATLQKGDVTRTKVFNLTVMGQATASGLAEQDKDAVTIIYGPGDGQNYVTQNITLPLVGSLHGSDITWISSKPEVINVNPWGAGAASTGGVVTRPAFGQGDKTVTLTASISRTGSATFMKEFTLTVKEVSGNEHEMVLQDKENLAIIYAAGENEDSVTQNVVLPKTGSNGSVVTWQSDQLNIEIQNSTGAYYIGKVTRASDTDKNVTLTAALVKGNATEIKTFSLKVIQQAASLTEQIQQDKDQIIIGYAPGDSADSVTQNITLQTSGANGTTINWVSDKPSVISSTGTVTRVGTDTTVTLTARVAKGGFIAERTFALKVIRTGGIDLNRDYGELEIGYAQGDHAGSVKRALYLTKTGKTGAAITWQSNRADIVNTTGRVTRPGPDSVNIPVRLTATLTHPDTGASLIKVFDITVIKLNDEEAVKEAAKSLTAEDAFSFETGDTWESVTRKFLFLTTGNYNTTISWTSDKPDVIRVIPQGEELTGQVARGEEDTTVILTATITKSEKTNTKTFLMVVKKQGVEKTNTRDNTGRNASASSQAGENPATENLGIKRTVTDDGKTDYVQLDQDKTTVLTDSIDPAADGTSRCVALTINRDDTNPADAMAVEIPAPSLSAMADRNALLEILTDEGHIKLREDVIGQLEQQGTDLYFRIALIQQQEEQQELEEKTKRDNNVIATGKTINLQGEPRKIETNYECVNAKVVLPFTGMTIPDDNRETFFRTLRVFVEHSDGTTELKEGTVVYQNGQPFGIEIEINKFSRFQIIELKSRTPSGGAGGPAMPINNPTNNTVRSSMRIGGVNRIETAVKIAEEAFSGTVRNVIITTANNYPDALAGSALAKKLNAPILLVAGTPGESTDALNYVKQHLEKNGTVYILGGTGVISNSFVTEFNVMGISEVKRLGGTDRIETSKIIADTQNVSQGTPVIIATKDNFPDALSISSAAAVKGYPILLSGKDSLSQTIKDMLMLIKPEKVYIAGGTGVLANSVVSDIIAATGLTAADIIRLGGSDRYDTSIVLAKYFNFKTDTAVIATGLNFPDALAGSVLAAQKYAPIILVDNDDISRQIQFIDEQEYSKFIILGREGAISKDIEEKLLKH